MEETKPLDQQSNKLLNGIVIVVAVIALGVIAFSIWRVLEPNQIKDDLSQLKTNCDFTSRSLNLLALNESWAAGYQAGASNVSKFYNDNLNSTIFAAQMEAVNQLCQRTPNPLANEQVFIGNRSMALCDYVAIRRGG